VSVSWAQTGALTDFGDDTMTHPTRQTRYARIGEILEAAAGDSTIDYGGAGRFWAHGVEALPKAKICGVRLIAPERPAVAAHPPKSPRSLTAAPRTRPLSGVYATRAPSMDTSFHRYPGARAGSRPKAQTSWQRGLTMAVPGG
jgi:hypothetical protein